jgi:outer membrane autotransporter protein
VGAALALGHSGWKVEPQLQLAYQRLQLNEFSDNVSAVSEANDDALRGRAAVQLFRQPTEWLGMIDASPYVGLGMQHDFRDASAITVGGTQLGDKLPTTTGDISAGFMGSLRPGFELHLDLRYQQSTQGERDGVRANFGFRATF